MRIISGIYGGRIISTPKSNKTHPMSEKMRGALFNVLGDITGLTVFDAYGGSGAIAMEAISRGAKTAMIAEVDKEALKIIKLNVASLEIEDKVKLVKINSATWVEKHNEFFDLVAADPPYNDISWNQLSKISEAVKPKGLMIISLPPDESRCEIKGFKILADKNYGDGSLVFYKRTK